QRQRLIHRKIVLQFDVHAELLSGSSRREEALINFRFPISDFRLFRWSLLASAATRIDKFHNLAVEQRAEQLPRALDVRLLLSRRFVAIADELAHRGATVVLA